MASMKKHSLIQVDFHTSVKLSPAELSKITKWLGMASQVMEHLIRKESLLHLGWLKNADSIKVSVLICGETKIRQLNRDYRHKDKVTDVLSFPNHINMRKAPAKSEFLTPELFLGDLAICHQRTIRQAKDFDISYLDEFIHLFMHGVIHLIGYDHELSDREEKLMLNWEKKALDIFSKVKKKGR